MRTASRPASIKMRMISAARAPPLYGNEIPGKTYMHYIAIFMKMIDMII